VKYLQENLVKYKIPKQFLVSDTLPLTSLGTSLGKIEKKTIQKQIKEEFAKS